MSFFDWFTGGSKTAETVAEGIYNGVDKIIYTDEEKAEASQRGFELFIEYQKATQPQNVARRHIAIIIVMLWSLFVLVAGVGVMLEWSYSAKLAKYIDEVLNYPFMLVMGFYYAKRIGIFNREKRQTD